MTEKLQKVLARSGYGSRREIEAMIGAGRIRVNGKVAQVGERIDADASVRIDGHEVVIKSESSVVCSVFVGCDCSSRVSWNNLGWRGNVGASDDLC